MERPKAKPFDEVNFKEMYDRIVKAIEVTLDYADEGFQGEGVGNDNEDIVNDYDQEVYEASVEAMYGKEYWDYFNSKVQ